MVSISTELPLNRIAAALPKDFYSDIDGAAMSIGRKVALFFASYSISRDVGEETRKELLLNKKISISFSSLRINQSWYQKIILWIRGGWTRIEGTCDYVQNIDRSFQNMKENGLIEEISSRDLLIQAAFHYLSLSTSIQARFSDFLSEKSEVYRPQRRIDRIILPIARLVQKTSLSCIATPIMERIEKRCLYGWKKLQNSPLSLNKEVDFTTIETLFEEHRKRVANKYGFSLEDYPDWQVVTHAGSSHAQSFFRGESDEVESFHSSGVVTIASKEIPFYGSYKGIDGGGASAYLRDEMQSLIQEVLSAVALKKSAIDQRQMKNACSLIGIRAHEKLQAHRKIFSDSYSQGTSSMLLAIEMDRSLWLINIGGTSTTLLTKKALYRSIGDSSQSIGHSRASRHSAKAQISHFPLEEETLLIMNFCSENGSPQDHFFQKNWKQSMAVLSKAAVQIGFISGFRDNIGASVTRFLPLS